MSKMEAPLAKRFSVSAGWMGLRNRGEFMSLETIG